MGALIRDHDWGPSALGRPSSWPQALRTAVRLMLNTRHPMYIFWGPEGACLYNDAYRPSIGPERHPVSLGRPAREVWDEIWEVIGPQIDQVMGGRGATWHENQLLPITRNGRREDVYWTYSYGPIDDEGAPNGVGGVLVVCTETTPHVIAERERRASEERLQMALSAGRGIGTWDWDVATNRVFADERFATLYDVDPEKARVGAPIEEFFQSVHPDDLPGLQAAIQASLRSDGRFGAEYRLIRYDGSIQWVEAQGRCSFDAQGAPRRFPGVTFDITDRKLAEERLRLSEEQLRLAVDAAEIGLWDVDPISDTLFWPPRVRAMFGVSDHVPVSLNDFYAGLHPDDFDAVAAAYASAADPAVAGVV